MNVSYEGIGEKAVTMKAADGLATGMLSKISQSDTAAACGEGDVFHGKALSVREGYAVIQLDGFVSAPYTGTAPQRATGPGVRRGRSVRPCGRGERQSMLVVSVDSTAKKVTFRL
jgi:hypothetical protein